MIDEMAALTERDCGGAWLARALRARNVRLPRGAAHERASHEPCRVRLMEHGAVIQDPHWYALADKAHQALFDLYQAIAAVHLEAE